MERKKQEEKTSEVCVRQMLRGIALAERREGKRKGRKIRRKKVDNEEKVA